MTVLPGSDARDDPGDWEKYTNYAGIAAPDQDESGLPEGLPVRVEVPENAPAKPSGGLGETAGQRLLKFAGKAVGLPPDAARNHDHYLYGTVKR